MTYRKLIAAGKTRYSVLPRRAKSPRLNGVFSEGAEWMYERMGELQPGETRSFDAKIGDVRPFDAKIGDMPPFDAKIGYARYGRMKYGICLAGALLCMWGMVAIGVLAVPVSIFFFYLLEVHLLFLFPLLIDGDARPVRASFRATYKIGLGRCLAVVVPIACYMMIGLLRKKDRLRNWYIGCLAILIWYHHEIRNRV